MQKTTKSRYFFPSHKFTFHSLVQFLLPRVKLNGVSQPISVEYKVVHGLIQAVITTQHFENLAVLDFSSYMSQALHCVKKIGLSL